MRSNNIFGLVFLILLNSSIIYSQKYEFSIQVKTSLLHVKEYEEDSNKGKYGSSLNFYPPLSIYLGNKFIIDEDYQIEISPGFLYAGENYSGFEAGLYLRRNIIQNVFFLALGMNFHYSSGEGHGTSILEYIPDGIYSNFAVAIGLYMSKAVSFNINYLKSLDEDFGYTSTGGNIYPRKLYGIIQAGFEFNL
jgi:hypothetical protein